LGCDGMSLLGEEASDLAEGGLNALAVVLLEVSLPGLVGSFGVLLAASQQLYSLQLPQQVLQLIRSSSS
jgi:hypothetical protein